MSKYHRDRSDWSPVAGTSFAVTHIAAPVRTGYSTRRSSDWLM